MVLNRLYRARVARDTISVLYGEVGEEALEPLDERCAVRSGGAARLFGVDDDRVERRGGGAIAFEQAANVGGLVLVRIERRRERLERRVELVPLGGALADLLTEVLRLELVPKLRLGRDVRFELLDELPSVVWKVVETFFLEVAEPCERRRGSLVQLRRLESIAELLLLLGLLLLWLRRSE